jgi:hypothetical protein
MPGRFLLASHCKKVKVHQRGIELKVGKKRMLFASDKTGPLIGRDVLVYYNLEYPDLLTVSDLNRQNHFAVKAISLPAMSASKDEFSAAHAQIAGHTKAARLIYGEVQHDRIATISRDDSVGEADAALGRFHNAETETFRQECAATTRTLRKIQTATAVRSLPVNLNIRNPGRVLHGIEMEDSWRAEQTEADIAAQEVPAPSDAATQPGHKTYILDAPAAAPSAALFWSLWAQVEKAKPSLNRHALTQKAIGGHPMPAQMTPAQLRKMIDVFSAILRDSKKSAAL